MKLGPSAVTREAVPIARRPVGAPTESIPVRLFFEVPPTLRDLFAWSGSSAAGQSAVTDFLTCPERSRLRANGVRRRAAGDVIFDGVDGLNALGFGTLTHGLRAIRVVHGHELMMDVLMGWRSEMDPIDFQKVRFMFQTYEQNYPRATDPLEYLGTEVEVRTDIARPGEPSIVRTVRYDTVVRTGGEVFSFEAKTMGRSGASSLNPYTTQKYTQVALWNNNPALVAQYGKMRGVIYDCLVKTTVPNVDRVGPHYVSRLHEGLALDYLRLPENGDVMFRKMPDGTYPKMLHACWGRWSPCDYIDLCHEHAFGEYLYANGQRYDGE